MNIDNPNFKKPERTTLLKKIPKWQEVHLVQRCKVVLELVELLET